LSRVTEFPSPTQKEESMRLYLLFVIALCGGALVINHARACDGPEEIRENVVIEAGLVGVSPTLAEAFMTIAGPQEHCSSQACSVRCTAFLSERQFRAWMSVFQAQASGTIDICQLPRITGRSGQPLELKVGDEMVVPILASDAEGNLVNGETQQFVGIYAKFLPAISADRQFVKLNVDFGCSNVQDTSGFQELRWTKTIVLPSSGTAVCLLELSGKGVCKQADKCLLLMLTTRVVAEE
jgi:hypothetical protein